MNIEYHEADPAQLDRVGRLGAELFIETFGHLYSVDDLQAHLNKVYSVEALRNDLATGRKIWIAQDDDQWIGFCKLGPVGLPIEPSDRRAVELKQMYVCRQFHGQGVGDGLMQIFFEWARQQKAEDLYISCWSENYRALAFYRRYGFDVVGAYTYWVGKHADDERILKRSL